jgi:putative cofactor-binding repeat protein
MATTSTTNLGLVKATAGTAETWNSGQIIGQNMDKLDLLATGVFNVASYGATHNGASDDYTAIQACIDAAGTYAASHGGAMVVFPPNQYMIGAAERINVYTGVTIWAYGAYIFKGGTPSVGLLCNFKLTDSFAGYTGNSRIRIYGGIWDGRGQNAASNAGYDTIDFNHCRDIICKDMVIRNGCSDHGLEFNSTDGGVALNCRFEGFVDQTSGLTRQFSEAVQIDCAESGSSTIGPFDGTHSKNIIIEGCYSGPAIDGSGLGSYGKLVGSHTTASGGKYSNIRIIGNVSDGSLDVGIGAYNWCDSVIAYNQVLSANSHGIRLTVPDPSVAGFSVLGSNVAVIGNTIDTTIGSGNVGIEVLGYTSTAGYTDITIVGNTIINTAGTGIFVELASNVVVEGNVIDTPGSNGINITACQYPQVTGNFVRHPQTNFGVFFGQVTSPSTVSTTDGQINGNICLLGSAATAGIRLSTGTDKCLVTGNTVRKDGGSQTVAVSCAGGVGTSNVVTQNDCTGFGSNANTITVSSGTVNKTIANDANVGTNLF